MIDLRCPGHVQLKSIECHSGIFGRNATEAVFKMAVKMASKIMKMTINSKNNNLFSKYKPTMAIYIIVIDKTSLKNTYLKIQHMNYII